MHTVLLLLQICFKINFENVNDHIVSPFIVFFVILIFILSNIILYIMGYNNRKYYILRCSPVGEQIIYIYIFI